MRTLLVVPFALAAIMAAPAVRAADPSVTECLAATENALKLRSDHKLRRAREQLLICGATTCPAMVRADCTRGVDEINALLPTVAFTVKTGAGQELSAVKVTMDGEVLTDHLDGNPLTVDPGSHEFTFATAGQPPVTQTFIVHASETGRRETIVVGPPAPALPLVVPPAPVPIAPAMQATTPQPPVSEPGPPGHGSSPLRTVGIVSGAAGIVGIVVGTAFGVEALATKSAHCGLPGTPAGACNSGAATTANGQATVSTAAFIAGGVLLAGGVVMFVFAPRGRTEQSARNVYLTPLLGPSTSGFQVGGTW